MDHETQSHCNQCAGTRTHRVLHRESSTWEDVIDDERGLTVDGSDTYEMLACAGCGAVSLRHQSSFSEHTDGMGRPEVKVSYYPPAIARRKPEWLSDLWTFGFGDHFVVSLLEEIYSALHNDSRRLAVMGIRALLEQVMIDKVKDHGRFALNLQAFREAGMVSTIQEKILGDALDAGHATIHRGFNPSREDVTDLIDITESIIETLYVHERKAGRVAKRIPARATRPPKET